MLVDCDQTSIQEAIQVDVCVIGSGLAALALARALSASRCSVAMVERGGLTAAPPQRDVLFKSRRYDGVNNGIAFGFGGTGALWGGQLLPMLHSELLALEAPWNTEEFAQELQEHYRTLESWVGVTPLPYGEDLFEKFKHDASGLNWGSFEPWYSKWIPFRRRNLGSAWKTQVIRSGRVKVLLNLKPQKWELEEIDGSSSIRYVLCRAPSGKTVRVEARHFVIAAGALESPLVLQQMLGDEKARELGVGHMLHDHLSLPVAEVENYRREEFERLFSPFFNGTTMRSLRMCLPDFSDAQGSRAVWAYCHFVIEAPDGSGFAVARDFLRGLQAKDRAKVMAALGRLPFAAHDILRMLWLRYAKQQLAIPDNSRVYVHVDVVQMPSHRNWIRTIRQKDGQDKVELAWDIYDDLKRPVDYVQASLASFWRDNGLERLGKINLFDFGDDPKEYLNDLYDIYHPAGTCAMGNVVDSNLQIFGIRNGYVVGSSVFPRLGRSNPTLTIMALALRLADFIGGSSMDAEPPGMVKTA